MKELSIGDHRESVPLSKALEQVCKSAGVRLLLAGEVTAPTDLHIGETGRPVGEVLHYVLAMQPPGLKVVLDVKDEAQPPRLIVEGN